jgi:hypothetical protein
MGFVPKKVGRERVREGLHRYVAAEAPLLTSQPESYEAPAGLRYRRYRPAMVSRAVLGSTPKEVRSCALA